MPIFFPQLRPGSAMQYPLRKATSYRTVVHPKDRVQPLRSADEGSSRLEWNLQLRGLSDTELDAIETLYRTMRGPHGDFVFLDPDGNLLARSEDFTSPVWNKTASLSIGVADTSPSVAETAFTLQSASETGAEMWQSLELPTNYHWLLSVYARAQSPAALTLFVRSTHGIQQHTVTLSAEWRRYWFGGLWWPAGGGIDVGLRLPPNAQAEATAAQLETQTTPAAYKRTLAITGAYEQSRFMDESLRVTSLAPNCHQLHLRIGAPFAG